MKININNIGPVMSVGASRQFPRDPRPEIALSGRSNVGKSSLINTLLGRKSLARVSSSPGKTITINYYDIDKKLLNILKAELKVANQDIFKINGPLDLTFIMKMYGII